MVICLICLSGCGVYMTYPSLNNSARWKVVAHNDTLLFRASNAKWRIDSVLNDDSKQVYHHTELSSFKLPASEMRPGINDVRLTFFVNGKKKRVLEHVFMVSDIEPKQVRVDNYRFLPHDEMAFTQGLLWWDGHLYESTGLVGESSLRIIDPENGSIIRKQSLNPKIFAEGIALLDTKLILLTWKDGEVYEFDKDLNETNVLPYEQEGWGLTQEAGRLIASNGTNELLMLSSLYNKKDSCLVYNHRGPVQYLNELECIKGFIWANVLGVDRLVVINPTTGKVEIEVDVGPCIDRKQYPNAGVLNGIAYDPHQELVYLTGKNWPYIIVWHPPFFDK